MQTHYGHTLFLSFGPVSGAVERDLEQVQKAISGTKQKRNILLNLSQRKSIDICRKIYEYNIWKIKRIPELT